MRLRPGLIASLVRQGKLDATVPLWISMVELSEVFGWTPDQIRRMKVSDLERYKAVLRGKAKRGEEVLSRHDKRII